ncbi:MAG: RagB/SusD family nutrient uptake outer membrane protein [Flavobacteriaceae bacterium]|nr:RagB/SusD family nutrient uptake outer membrane protein [Flavobacteriaceae bacterium]
MMKKYLILIVLSLLSSSCDDYLDIVPDKTQELSLLFQRKNAAYTALVTCYSYIPQNDGIYSTFVLASDEFTTPQAKETDAIRLMKGLQTTSDPIMSYWSGYGASGRGQGGLFQGIRACNELIENIDQVVDMTQDEKIQWKSEAMFLKAYYHYLLLTHYGPIPIVDVNLPISSDTESVKVNREPVDEVFNYIFSTIDTAIKGLPERVSNKNELGRIDKVIALSLKSRVALFYASPMFNGNSEFYGGFVDQDGVHYFNQIYDKSRWEFAAEVTEQAIEACLANGISLYNFNAEPPTFDSYFYYNNQTIPTMYDLRYAITEPWNSELVWGNSMPVGGSNSWWQIQAGALMKSPTSSSVEAAWQWIAPTMRMAELYYTRNGLPIDEDLNFDYENRFETSTASTLDPLNLVTIQNGQRTAKLNMGREARFYANLAFDRGYNRTWGQRWFLRMRKGETHGRIANSNDYLTTGYGLKKLVHPDSEGDGYDKLIDYPWPMIRLAELYLNHAEALNEANGPTPEVYSALNEVRQRAGVPDVEVVWSDATKAKTVNKHTTLSGMREIIQTERMIELSFEGHRYYDLRRWLLADQHFNAPVMGWSVDETNEDDYYQVQDVGQRSFNKNRDYLHPISTDELARNSNLIQNPGW